MKTFDAMKTILLFTLSFLSLGLMAQQASFNAATGTVQGRQYVGGLIGGASGTASSVTHSYAKGDVSGQSHAGGLIGSNAGAVSDCYAVGVPDAPAFLGGFAGSNAGSITRSYWDTERSGQLTSAGGTGRTTDEMTWPYAPNAYEGWDFSTIWTADETPYSNDGYPLLRQSPVHRLQVRAYPPDGGVATGGGYFKSGQQARVEAVADPEFNFLGWYLGNLEVSSDADLDWTVTTTQTLTARFVRRPNSTQEVASNDMPTVRLYPNPVRGSLTVDIQGGVQPVTSLRLFHPMGYLLREERLSGRGDIRWVMDVSSLQPGIYFIQVAWDGGQLTRKIVRE
jgi:hypothetical protein